MVDGVDDEDEEDEDDDEEVVVEVVVEDEDELVFDVIVIELFAMRSLTCIEAQAFGIVTAVLLPAMPFNTSTSPDPEA